METGVIGALRVTAPRAFRRAGIGFAAGVNSLDLLSISAVQLIALVAEPMLTVEGRLSDADPWTPLPLPSAADLPALEAEFELAKARIAEMRASVPQPEPIAPPVETSPVPDGADQPAAPDAPTDAVADAPAAPAAEAGGKGKAAK